MTLTLEGITQAITERLKRGFTDGYCYDRDEWHLLKVKEIDRQTTLGRIHAYYALVEISTPDPENAIAVFEVDEGEEATLVGDSEAYFPDDAEDIEL